MNTYREMRDALAVGISVEEVADHLFKAKKMEQLYVLTDREHLSDIRKRMESILEQKNL